MVDEWVAERRTCCGASNVVVGKCLARTTEHIAGHLVNEHSERQACAWVHVVPDPRGIRFTVGIQLREISSELGRNVVVDLLRAAPPQWRLVPAWHKWIDEYSESHT